MCLSNKPNLKPVQTGLNHLLVLVTNTKEYIQLSTPIAHSNNLSILSPSQTRLRFGFGLIPSRENRFAEWLSAHVNLHSEETEVNHKESFGFQSQV